MVILSKVFKRIEKVEAVPEGVDTPKVIEPQLPSKEAMEKIAEQVKEAVKEEEGDTILDKVNSLIEKKRQQLRREIEIRQEALKVLEGV